MSTLREEAGKYSKSLALQTLKTDIAQIDAIRKLAEITKPVQIEKAHSSIVDSISLMETNIMSIFCPEGAGWPEDPP